MTRQPLPTRRPCVTMDTEWQGIPMTVTVGLYPETGQPGECFAGHAKDSRLCAQWADNCTALSVAMQYGVPPADLAKSMGSTPFMAIIDGAVEMIDAPASPLGVIIGCVVQEVRK